MKYLISRILIKLKFSHVNPVCWGQSLVMSMLRWDVVTVRYSGAGIGPNPATDLAMYHSWHCDSGSGPAERGKKNRTGMMECPKVEL